MRITALLNTLNAKGTIKHRINSIYAWVDMIVIIDGAYNNRVLPQVSNDGTELEVIKYFDPLNKIRFIIGPGECEANQKNKMFDYVSPDNTDWVIMIDQDELYSQDSMNKLTHFLKYNESNQDGYYIKSYDFVNSTSTYRDCNHKRIFRIKEGCRFKGINVMFEHKRKYDIIKSVPDVVKFHYAYLGGYDEYMRKKNCIPHNFNWEFKDGKYYREGLQLKDFKGVHPECVSKNNLFGMGE